MMQFILGLLKPFALKILMGAVMVGTVAAILFGARQAGRTAERVEGLRRQLKNVEKRRDVENDIDRASDDDVDRRLRAEWQRD
ncbi:MAG: hypothetical protein WD407_08740 [Rhodospirillales bacterium]